MLYALCLEPCALSLAPYAPLNSDSLNSYDLNDFNDLNNLNNLETLLTGIAALY